MDDSRIELVARAFCEADGKDPDETHQGDKVFKQTGRGLEETYEDVPNWRGHASNAKKFVMAFDVLTNSKS